jgi:hypothetical protein
MKKRTIGPAGVSSAKESEWLPLDELAEVEITSESAEHPIEAALVPGRVGGWRAETAGKQTIRVRFEQPRRVQSVRVVIEERERARTQEFVLRAAVEPAGPWREIARQQFNFSPAGATREQEDYQIALPSVAGLELTIIPEIGGGDARASLQQFRVAG